MKNAKAKATKATKGQGGKGTKPAVQRASRLNPDQKIKWLTKENPKRSGGAAHARFAKYMGKPTVGAYVAAGGLAADLRYDEKHGYLQVQ